MSPEDSDAAIASALTPLGDPAVVGILRRLTADRGAGRAVRAEARSDSAVAAACDRLVDAGLASVNQDGCTLEPPGVLLAAAVLTLARVLGLGCTHGDGLLSVGMFHSHDPA